MDKKILGNLVAYVPPIIYVIYTFMTHQKNTGVDWTEVIIAAIIAMISSAAGKQIKNKGEVE